MSITGVSITKSTTFRGVAQEFSNTYYYETPLGVSSGTAEALIDSLVTKERAAHSGNVSFKRARAWSAGGTAQQNQMLFQKNLSGVGSATPPSSTLGYDKERAFLVRARAGVDSRGRPVYLRKWWHLEVNAVGNVGISAGQLANIDPLNSTQRAALVTLFDDFKSVNAGVQGFQLVSENGRTISGDTIAHPYLEHHQLGDMWRG